MRVFIGTYSGNPDAVKVCEYSLLKHLEMNDQEELAITHINGQILHDAGLVLHAGNTHIDPTRFMVPQLCAFQGKTLFCTDTFLFNDNIRHLFDMLEDNAVARTKEGCDLIVFNNSHSNVKDMVNQKTINPKNYANLAGMNWMHKKYYLNLGINWGYTGKDLKWNDISAYNFQGVPTKKQKYADKWYAALQEANEVEADAIDEPRRSRHDRDEGA